MKSAFVHSHGPRAVLEHSATEHGLHAYIRLRSSGHGPEQASNSRQALLLTSAELGPPAHGQTPSTRHLYSASHAAHGRLRFSGGTTP